MKFAFEVFTVVMALNNLMRMFSTDANKKFSSQVCDTFNFMVWVAAFIGMCNIQ